MRRRLLLPLTLFTLLIPTGAAAQNADGVLLGIEAATAGGAVITIAGDAATAFYNPAGLASIAAPSVQVSGSAYSISTLDLGHFVDTRLPWTATEQSVRTTSFFSVPAVAAYGFRLRPGLGVAAGVWVPSHQKVAFTSELRSEGAWSPGGSVTQASYEQHLSLSQLLDRTYFGVAAGLAATARLRVGISGFVTYDSAENFVSVFAVAKTNSPVPAETGGTISITASGAPAQFALRFGGGLQWDLAPTLTVGLAVKTPSVAIARRGTVSSTVSVAALFPGEPPAIAFTQDTGEPLRLQEPWRIAAGGSVAVGRWSLRAEGDWQAATSGQRAVGNARLGALHDGGDLRWGAGLFTDRSRELASAGGLSVDYYGGTTGLSYRPAPVAKARAAGGDWDLWTSLAIRYAYGTGEATGFGLAPLGGTVEPPKASVRAHHLTLTLGGLVQF